PYTTLFRSLVRLLGGRGVDGRVQLGRVEPALGHLSVTGVGDGQGAAHVQALGARLADRLPERLEQVPLDVQGALTVVVGDLGVPLVSRQDDLQLLHRLAVVPELQLTGRIVPLLLDFRLTGDPPGDGGSDLGELGGNGAAAHQEIICRGHLVFLLRVMLFVVSDWCAVSVRDGQVTSPANSFLGSGAVIAPGHPVARSVDPGRKNGQPEQYASVAGSSPAAAAPSAPTSLAIPSTRSRAAIATCSS